MPSAASGVSLAIAGLAGLLSFLSPCVLPLIPSYIGFITGLTAEETGRRRHVTLLHAVCFVAGFSLIFIVLGASVSLVGGLLVRYQVWLGRLGGVLILLLAFYLLGAFRPGWLARERRLELTHKPLGYAGSVVVGVTFGAAWTPCIGPILGAILTLAATRASAAQGTGLLAAYAAGLAVPFLLTAVLLERFLEWFQGFRRYLPWVERVSGALLLVLGVLLLTDRFTLLAGYLQGLTPNFLRSRL